MPTPDDIKKALELLGQAQRLLEGPGSPVGPGPAHEEPTGKLICIDPGHGGHDSGAAGVEEQVEKNLVLDYATLLGASLTGRGQRVMYTRMDDRFIPLSERAKIANVSKADVFVSLHANSAENKAANGAWVIYDDKSPTKGKALAEAIFAKLRSIPGIDDLDQAAEVYPDGTPWVGNRQLTVISKTVMPAALVELGFMTNEDDLNQLRDISVKQEVCRAIAIGIVNFLQST